MFIRAIAIMAPGMFLSQPPTTSTPSMHCALHAVSIESAITSRETSEYFIPSVPMAIPSLTVIVPNICGIVPAPRSAASARRARASSPRLQGVKVLNAFATPTIGLSKSPSPHPTARSMARLGERWGPSVMTRLRWFSSAMTLILMRNAECGGRHSGPGVGCASLVANLFGYALAHRRGAERGRSRLRDVRGPGARGQDPLDGRIHGIGFHRTPEAVAEQHGDRRDGADGVRDAAPGDVGRRAVDRLEQARPRAQRCRRQQPERAGQHRRLVAQDVP